MNYFKQVKLMNKYQILSLDLRSGLYIDEFLSIFIIDSSFNYLESITLHFMEEYFLLLLLRRFICLPRLLSLNVHADETLTDLSDVYQLGFALPILKYFKIKSEDWIVSLPFATTNQQFSTVKYLVIDHYCTFDQLATILSYTPELCHLYFEHQPDRDSNVEIILPITLSNLTRISLKIIRSDYDEVIKFLKKISSKLKFLRLTIQSNDVIYLISHLWEGLILQYFPNLEKFYLKHFESIDYDNRSGNYLWQGNQFTSSFWIERQWIFHAEIYIDEIIYSIYPDKITWYDSAESEINSMHSIEQKPTCTSSILTINNRHLSGYLELLYENIIWMTIVTTIYRLQFCQQRIPIHTLIKIINFLSNLDSLKVWSLSLSK
ncbi:unnamed protein product [Rotaria sordida]|uniref:Uncharacterized protein n=1 Tax=Rotaria sordida TaxID=392033 RepID=A0A814VRL6_9BILA|nr:unnamed protein product [Rotaria sordida]CAF3927713.1 unnamed protein product [Rotaria sordida]